MKISEIFTDENVTSAISFVQVIHPDEDAICVYEFESMRYTYKTRIGIVEDGGNIL